VEKGIEVKQSMNPGENLCQNNIFRKDSWWWKDGM